MPLDTYEATGATLRTLLAIAWLAPLLGFVIEIFGGYWSGRERKTAAYLAVGCIGLGFVCSICALIHWGQQSDWAALRHGGGHHASRPADQGVQTAKIAVPSDHDLFPATAVNGGQALAAVSDEPHDSDTHAHTTSDEHVHTDGAGGHAVHAGAGHNDHAGAPTAFFGTFYTLATFGDLRLSIDYYIDSLTLVMFVMVTLIATCIHIFAIGYMSDELTEDHVDHEVHVSGGGHLHRPGRFYKFFSFMSLFCFSMLGLVLAGNIFQVFIFWELVGICSYLLIGFYVERKSASTAANKAFIVNRVGDFGFLIGLMVIWTWFGTFHFADPMAEAHAARHPGLFQMIRGADGELDVDTETGVVLLHDADGSHLLDAETGQPRTIPYMLLVVVGVGIFAGCIGKSAQFPLQTWLPDAMEGPTPVSALVHSATMVAAGVYLAGRFYPMFTPEVLLVIAYIGCITLFLAATIAVVATDIKRVLAYSTISQLGYMMLAIGVAGWAAGLFHLITHAFFKSLMFLCSGSVIVGCHHEQEMPRMGGLLRKMPWTALTMLVGVVAICGLAVPGLSILGCKVAFSGFHSKDAIIATALSFTNLNPTHYLLFLIPLATAGITAFYMFRLWFYTFLGEPRDREMHEHVHESPWVMVGPLVLLSGFAAFCAAGGEAGSLFQMLLHSEPAGVAQGVPAMASAATPITLPSHDQVHLVHAEAGSYALLVAFGGMLVAFLLYVVGIPDPGEIKRQFAGLHRFLVNKWQFDELYDVMFVRPVHIVAGWCAAIDRRVFDGFLHGACRGAIDVSRWDRMFDERIVDGLVNLVGDVTFSIGRSLRSFQTGNLRQYIMFIAVGVLMLFILVIATFPM